jgi:hypothetical protein
MADRPACLPLVDWPALDRELWTQAFRGNDLFEAIGPAGRWRPRTVETVREGYGHALAWLERRGLLDRRQSPDACPTPSAGATKTGARTPPSIAMACRSPCSRCARFARGTSRT